MIRTNVLLLFLVWWSCCCFCCGGVQATTAREGVDHSRQTYFQLEKSLWKRIVNEDWSSPTTLAVVQDHRQFINQHLNSTWDQHKYSILTFHEWTTLVHKLMLTEELFVHFRQLLDSMASSSGSREEDPLSDAVSKVLLSIVDRNPESGEFSLQDTFEEMELVMVKQALFYRALLVSPTRSSLD